MCVVESIMFYVKLNIVDRPAVTVAAFPFVLPGSRCISCCLSALGRPLYIVCVLLSGHENRPI